MARDESPGTPDVVRQVSATEMANLLLRQSVWLLKEVDMWLERVGEHTKPQRALVNTAMRLLRNEI